MKKPYLVHLFWAFVAIAAFALGSKSGNPDHASDDTANRNGKNSTSSPSSRTTRNDQTASSRARSINSRNTGDDQEALITLSESDIRKIGSNLKSAKGPLERREIFAQILANLTAENATLMREQLLHLDSNSNEFREFHYAWGAIAGEEALLHGVNSPERDAASTLAGWAAKSPEAALAYFNNLDEAEQKNSALKWGALYGLTDADPNLAIRFAMDQQEAGDKDTRRLVETIARQILRNGATADAANWATTLPAGDIQNAAVSRIAREYADEDPQATIAWASTLPASNSKNGALKASFNEWAKEDPQAAAEQLNTMTESTERDSATYGYANRVSQEDPQAGIEWATTINDPTTRTQALIETGRTFYRQEPEAAKEWLTNSGLTPQQQQSVTRRTRRRG